jgi:hypothetical protein
MATSRSVALHHGQIVRVRSRQYLVESLVPPPNRGDQTLVRLSLPKTSSPRLNQLLAETA